MTTRAARVYALGAAAAVTSAERDNTSVLFVLDGSPILIEFPGSINQKLERIGFNLFDVRRTIVTHTHVDHLYGLPSFLHHAYVRRKYAAYTGEDDRANSCELTIIGYAETVEFVRNLLDVFDFIHDPDMFPLRHEVVEAGADGSAFAPGWRLHNRPGAHGDLRTLGSITLRIWP